MLHSCCHPKQHQQHQKKPIAPTKRLTTKDTRPAAEVPADLGKLIQRDVKLVEELGWEDFVKRRRGAWGFNGDDWR